MRQFSKLLLIGSLALALFACATTHSGANGANSGSSNANSADGAQTYGANDQSGVSGTNQALVAPANQTYHFDFDKSDIQPGDMASIQAQSNYLASHPNAKVELDGNTDSRGSREYNVALGWRRARSVAQTMEQFGVNKSQLVLVSYGQEKPVALGDTEQDYALNRRVDLKYLSQG